MTSAHENFKNLLQYLQTHGPTSAKTLCQLLAISQPTLSRLLASAKDQIISIGKGRAVVYAAYRTLGACPPSLPIFEILSKGESRVFGILHALAPTAFYLEAKCADATNEMYPDLPYFLNDLRPSGFLGQLIPLQHPELKFPQDIRTWSTQNILKYLSTVCSNPIGNFIVGEESFKLYLSQSQNHTGIVSKNKKQEYTKLAADVLSLGEIGSSAGGDQPKFTAVLLPEQKHVLVKFSPPKDTRIGIRIADLLICEHLALRTLEKYGFAATKSEVVEHDNRIFLELTRFDREPSGGRHGLISLGALDEQFTGIMSGWQKTAGELAKLKIIPASCQKKIQALELFCALIGNNDMHLYNLSFFTLGNKVTGLSPVYDMSPMLFMPRHHQIIDKKFNPQPPTPDQFQVWTKAFEATLEFWEQVCVEKRISHEFNKIAQECLKEIEKMASIKKLIPKN